MKASFFVFCLRQIFFVFCLYPRSLALKFETIYSEHIVSNTIFKQLRFDSDGFIKLYAKGDIILKKLTTVALTGALALGALAGLGSFDAKPAAAAEKSAAVQAAAPYDSWGITDTSILYQFIDPMPAEYKEHLLPAYKTLNWFTVVTDWSANLTANDQVKIFRVEDDGTLSRYKTINWIEQYDYQKQKHIAVWQEQITDNYHPGNYVAVSYIGGKHLKSDFFTINK